MRRMLFICTQLVFSATLLAQKDSARALPEHEVTAMRFGTKPNGLFVQETDTLLYRFHAASNLEQLLSAHSGVFVKQAGPSQLASPGFRGGSAAQTAVVWNGFSLNHAMLGQVDLSLFPAFLTDKVQVQYGSQAALYGSGQVSGAIYLQNQKADTGFHADVLLSAASFGDYAKGLKTSWAQTRFQVKQKFYHRKARNNYPFLNTLMFPVQSQETQHAELETQAWMQDIRFVPKANHKLEFHSWLQASQRQIPAVLESNSTPSSQEDKLLRISANYQIQHRNWQWNFRSAFFNELMWFTAFRSNPAYSQARQFIQAIDQSFVYHNHKLISGLQWNYSKGTNSSYSGSGELNQLAFFSSLESGWLKGKFRSQLSLRKELNSFSAVPLLPAIGLNVQLMKGLHVRGSWALAYRVPTLNDLFWSPGGNPNLLPERSSNSELGVDYASSIFNLSLNGFHRLTKNLIVWIPGASFPQVENLKQAEAYGLEFIWKAAWGNAKTWVRLQGNHEVLRSINLSNPNDDSYGKQLIYVPRVRHNFLAIAGYRNFSLSWLQTYTGQRYTSTDNANALQDYLLADLRASANFNVHRHRFQLDLACRNLFDTTYAIMLNRPMPGRSFLVQLNYSI